MKIETKCLHEGYKPKNGEPVALPIYQSTTYRYDSTEAIGKLFDLTAEGHMYSRISNPTVGAVEDKIASLEGGIGALCTSSGQAASLISILNILKAGDHIISAATIYGGTINLFAVTLKRFGIECTFVDPDSSDEEIQKEFRENTKVVFGETIANPAIAIFDIERFAKIAHRNNVPLIIDNTFATPILCRPIEFGADIVIQSTTKYMDGHAVQVGGVIVDSGNFDWTNGNFSEFTEPDESYHGVIYSKDFGKSAYITKARVQLMRDLGAYIPANAAFLLNLGLETLSVRIEKHCRNAEKVAEFLSSNEKVEFVNYPTVKGNKYEDLARKYLPNGCSGVVSFSIKGSRENAIRFMDNLKLAENVVHVADIRTCVLHPASSIHRQLTDEQLVSAGITPGLVRLSVGLENIDDILEDVKQALDQV
ncbi:O-acetylhomoserine aminocarboxypropyltransferase/cysteine synthase [Clostridium botulinum]|uniref:O-acetylhomoserine aminocarboxypropyltransferase/cysteine synthase family protein n=1 Tax=Clostridium botulinum (strain Eklund 17B / Type B) TaxID=935198 RepID=B2TIT4_CLOBB|nr:O-acetylhomoserine aminocarboxypropyltransferase/cysteine synthase family protein [Clostridium botulinum B str. Eklund 17B (NRP)]MBY6977555.1 O-acetylhomoserine aminocarboxypropyltransferase/cysteine synthase [Clostridium botulinum]MBY7001741.1 O-acetylhomoserine aminocarboxypropyltransferase/cysteine synthase [Clostridium botulinum]MCR1275484.1 O-acetylhomoserine aminocarboxypropyltransferase/cysteine synthase [Clostridium botulinum]NFD70932.1 O-acetylhomoserine aminocarboxypropyltransferas